jgi:hypothetical protein
LTCACCDDDKNNMTTKLTWKKHLCGGFVAIIPVELGGKPMFDSSVHIVPNAFATGKSRVRLRNHALEPYFFHNQFYSSTAEAKRVVTAKLNELAELHRRNENETA